MRIPGIGILAILLVAQASGCEQEPDDDATADDDDVVDDDDQVDDDTADDDDLTDDDSIADDDSSADDDTGDDDDDAGDDDDTSQVEWGTTYYVRTDGGDATQCTGLADAAYPGSGTGQPCAFIHPFIALPPGGSPVLAGGDRLIIADGEYRMGHGAPGDGNCDAAYPWDCYMPVVPSGTDADHPTRIVGAGWNGGCATAPQLYGAERAYRIFDLTAADHVLLACMEITDHDECVEFHSGAIACNRDSYPYGDWAGLGIMASASQDVTLRDLNIHGMAHGGIHAGQLTDWTLDGVRIAGNGWVGFDGDVNDIAGNSNNAGTTTFRRVTIEWNGCGETYPGGLPTGCWGQSAGGYGDGLGTESTGGDWVFEDCKILHNTSDGLDLLYHDQGGSITIDRLHAEGNAGNQLKVTGNTTVSNSILVGNCAYFDGQPFTYNVDNCRALGNTVHIAYVPGSTASLVNSTIYGQGDLLIGAGPRTSCDGTETLQAINNIYIGDDDYNQAGDTAVLYYQEDCNNLALDQDYGVIWGTRPNNQSDCPMGAHDICEDPQVTGPLSGDAFGLELQAGSPAIDAGQAVGGLIPAVDFNGQTRPLGNGVDIGAYELM